jgi:hypothetical protein
MLSRGSASGKMKAEPSILHSHTEYGNEENEEQSMGTRKNEEKTRSFPTYREVL